MDSKFQVIVIFMVNQKSLHVFFRQFCIANTYVNEYLIKYADFKK